MSETIPVRIVYEAADLLIGSWHNVCLGVWKLKPTVESTGAMKEQYVALARRRPAGIVLCGVIAAGVPIPDEAARSGLTAAMAAVDDKILAAAVTIEGEGFMAAAARAASASMSVLTRSRYPRKFFSTVEVGAAWVAPHASDAAGRSVPAGDVVAAASGFRARAR